MTKEKRWDYETEVEIPLTVTIRREGCSQKPDLSGPAEDSTAGYYEDEVTILGISTTTLDGQNLKVKDDQLGSRHWESFLRFIQPIVNQKVQSEEPE